MKAGLLRLAFFVRSYLVQIKKSCLTKGFLVASL